MYQLNSSSESVSFKKFCRNAFKNSSWEVTNAAGQPDDFIIDNGVLKCRIVCVDQSVFRLKSVEAVSEMMETHTRNRGNWVPIVFLLNFKTPVESHDKLLEKNIVAFSNDEISLVSDLPLFMIDVERQLVERQRTLLELNSWACIALARLNRDAGRRIAAKHWAKRAIKPTDPVGSNYHIVFGLLVNAGETEEAYQLASEGALRRKDDRFLLEGLIKLSQDRFDHDAVSHWSRLLNVAANGEATGIYKLLQPPASKVPERDSKPKSGLFRLFRRGLL